MSSPLSPITGAHGALQLLTETDPVAEMIRRAVRLEATPDGRSVLLVDVDSRRPGIHREVRYEITPAELISAIRAPGAGRGVPAQNPDEATRPLLQQGQAADAV